MSLHNSYYQTLMFLARFLPLCTFVHTFMNLIHGFCNIDWVLFMVRGALVLFGGGF